MIGESEVFIVARKKASEGSAPEKTKKKRSTEFNYIFYVNGERVEKLTDEQKAIIGERFGQALSDYYSRHMDEYVKLPDCML
jgi:hypothetical protein